MRLQIYSEYNFINDCTMLMCVCFSSGRGLFTFKSQNDYSTPSKMSSRFIYSETAAMIPLPIKERQKLIFDYFDRTRRSTKF